MIYKPIDHIGQIIFDRGYPGPAVQRSAEALLCRACFSIENIPISCFINLDNAGQAPAAY